MMFIVIEGQVISIDTLAECEAAEELLEAAGIKETQVYSGDPEGDAEDTGMVVFSTSARRGE